MEDFLGNKISINGKFEKVQKKSLDIEVLCHIKTVNLLELSPAILQEYSKKVQRIQIRVFRARFQVHGQITLSLLIDERGKVTISSITDTLTVKPASQKRKIINGIKFKINNYILIPSPKDKKGNPVKFNWRVTYKVGKYLNRIILNKM